MKMEQNSQIHQYIYMKVTTTHLYKESRTIFRHSAGHEVSLSPISLYGQTSIRQGLSLIFSHNAHRLPLGPAQDLSRRCQCVPKATCRIHLERVLQETSFHRRVLSFSVFSQQFHSCKYYTIQGLYKELESKG